MANIRQDVIQRVPNVIINPYRFADVCDSDFIMEVTTSVADTTFTLGLLSGVTYNAEVDWGDGDSSTITAYNDSDRIHTYTDADTYTVRISGTMPAMAMLSSSSAAYIISILSAGNIGVTNYSRFMEDAENLVTVDMSCGDGAPISCNQMFDGCSKLTTLDLSGVDFSSCTSFRYMFSYCSDLTGPIDFEGKDLSLVTTMYAMFNGNSDLTEVSFKNCDMRSVTTFGAAFLNATTLVDLDFDGVQLEDVTNMSSMFSNTTSLSQASVDSFLKCLYENRNNFTWSTPAVNLSGITAEPSGTYQSASPPTTGKEYAYFLENDPDTEGFNTWTITL